MIGPEKVIWRYDPIFLNETYTFEYHIHYFEELANVSLHTLRNAPSVFWISTGIQKKTLLDFLSKSLLKKYKSYLPKALWKLQKVTDLKWILAQKVLIYKNMELIMRGV